MSAVTLVKKLADVMKEVERIPKRGRNEFHKYDYATEADIVSAVRAELSKRSIVLIPAIVGESRHQVGEKGSVLTVLEMEMEFLDGESGESIKKPWRGYGSDKEDKGGYKAMTGGEKYFLLKTFLMPTGDDPEADEQPRTRQAARSSRQPQQANTITKDQRNELAKRVEESGWRTDEIVALLNRHGFNNSREITVDKFALILSQVKDGVQPETVQ